MKNEPKSKGYTGTVRLLHDDPKWAPIVAAALEKAKVLNGQGMAGAWVLALAKERGILWLPNLRKLVSYGILEKEGESTRGGRRAYYIMFDMEGVEAALIEMNVPLNVSPYSGYGVDASGVKKYELVRLPFYANLASCGGPNMSEAHIDDYVDVDARIAPLGHQYFLVRADGDSMNLAGIQSGDILLVRVQNYADIGQKVLVCLAEGTTIKEFQRQGQYVALMPRSTNPDHKPIVLTDNAEIQGIVVATIPSFQ
jgi:SOS-response transcriptional repressor LexA